MNPTVTAPSADKYRVVLVWVGAKEFLTSSSIRSRDCNAVWTEGIRLSLRWHTPLVSHLECNPQYDDYQQADFCVNHQSFLKMLLSKQ